MRTFCNIYLFLLLFLFSNTRAQVQVDRCGTYSTSSVTYIQTRDILEVGTASNPCILITGSNATYNGNGYQISPLNNLGNGIAATGRNVSIIFTIILNCDVGISLNGALGSASYNRVESGTKIGIRSIGAQSVISFNSILNFEGSSVQGIYVFGSNTVVHNNTVSGIIGMPVAGIYFSSLSSSSLSPSSISPVISNNFVYGVSTPNNIGTCLNWFDASIGGIVVNATQPVIIKNNIIQNIGGGGCSNPMTTVALAALFASTSSITVINNTIANIQGSGLLGDAVGIACYDNSNQATATSTIQITNSTITTVSVGQTIATAYGILSHGCNVIANNNGINRLNGTAAYGIYGKAFQSYSIYDNNISQLFGFANFSVGVVVYLVEAGVTGGLFVENNNVGPMVDYPYYFYANGSSKEMCGGVQNYHFSSATCFPPGDNCCATDCTRLCDVCDDSCGLVPADTYTCGDGICSAGENCTTCNADCSCAVCGNEICDSDAGETCTSCPSDCGTCAPVCPRNCSGHGTCVENGICVCDDLYAGRSCNKVTTDFHFDVNSTRPGTTISYNIGNKAYAYNLSLSEIRELKSDGTVVRSFSLFNVSFEPAPQSFFDTLLLKLLPYDTSVYKHVYGVLPNGAKILYSMIGLQNRTKVVFGKKYVSVPPKSIKINVQIWDWPFLSIFNQLEVYTDAYAINEQSAANISYTQDDFGNIRTQEISSEKSSLFMNVFPYSIIDGTLRRMQVRETTKGVAIVIPFFLFRAIYDPDFSVLVDPNHDSDSSSSPSDYHKNSNDINTVGLVVGIVVSVAAVAFIAVFIKVLYPKLKERHTVKDAKKRKSMENVY